MKKELHNLKKQWLNIAKDPSTKQKDAIDILEVFGDIAPYIENVRDCKVYEDFLEKREFDRYGVIYLDCIIEWCYEHMYDEDTDNADECEHEIKKIVDHFIQNEIKGFQYDW